MRILVVLQNPYNKGSLASGWNPSNWRSEFESSRSGSRLADAFPWECSIHYTNANPKIGDGVDSKLEPNLKHLRRRVRDTLPDLVIPCGKVAEVAMLKVWNGPMIAIPHPASRTLSNRLLEECRQCIMAWMMYRKSNTVKLSSFYDPVMTELPRIALRQKRGDIAVEIF